MNESMQKGIALLGVAMFVGFFLNMTVTDARKKSMTPQEFCAQKGADGRKIIEVRCLRRLNAGICYDEQECKAFPGHRYVDGLDSSRDIRCEGDTGGNHYTDFGVTGCEYRGRDGAI